MGFGYAWEKDKHNNQLIDAAREVRFDGAAGEWRRFVVFFSFPFVTSFECDASSD